MHMDLKRRMPIAALHSNSFKTGASRTIGAAKNADCGSKYEAEHDLRGRLESRLAHVERQLLALDIERSSEKVEEESLHKPAVLPI